MTNYAADLSSNWIDYYAKLKRWEEETKHHKPRHRGLSNTHLFDKAMANWKKMCAVTKPKPPITITEPQPA